MSVERVEWVEIIEPKTKEHMYANLTTGECVWDPPVGVPVKKTDNNQWWELFDENTSRFYYYNATSQKTVWHRPDNSDIIPLAKLQTLKQNTEPATDIDDVIDKKIKETVATQTPSRISTNKVQTAVVTSTKPMRNLDIIENSNVIIKPSFLARQAISCETQTSPLSPRRSHHHHHHHHHHHNHRHQQSTPNDNRVMPVKIIQTATYNRNHQSQDSGRSSDSSSISGCTKQQADHSNNSLSQQFGAINQFSKKNQLTEANSMPPSGSTARTQIPLIHRTDSNASQRPINFNKQKSFDTDISIGGGYSLGHENRGVSTRTKPAIMTSSLSGASLNAGPTGAAQVMRSQSFAHQQKSPSAGPNNSAATDEDEDSMHEKYFSPNILNVHPKKSAIESTPLIRRKQHNFEMNSPTFSNSGFKGNVPEYANFMNPGPPPPTSLQKTASLHSRSSSSNSSSVASKHQLALMKSRSESKFSSDDDLNEDDDAVNDSSSLSISSSPPTAATPPRKLSHANKVPVENNNSNNLEPNIARTRPGSNHSASSSSNRGGGSNSSITQSLAEKRIVTPNSEKRIVVPPLYCNLDFSDLQKRAAHLLPLHQYILEQAKLSGSYKVADHGTVEDDPEWAFHSEDEEHLREYDSDEFADDEGMSNVEDDDSSSQEYLHDEHPMFFHDEAIQPSTITTSKSQKKWPIEGGNRVYDFEVDGGVDDPSVYYNVLHGGSTMLSASSNYSQPSGHHNNTNNLVTPNSMSGLRTVSPGLLTLTSSETQHTSLKRRKDPPQNPPALYSPILERSEVSYCGGLNKEKKLPSESDIEKYAQDNLNIHKRGLFRKKFSVRAMLSWSKDPIRKPMLVLSDKTLKKEACEMFKLVQIYMSDRKAKIGMTLNNVALEICNMGYTKSALRDELYIQICRQTTENPRKESLRRGWELLAICLSFFPPSPKFQVYLDSYMNRHRDPSYDFPEVGKWPIHVQVSHYATIACKRLERGGVNGKRAPKKPTLDEIDQSRLQIFRPSMFGSTLQEIMSLQKERFPHYRLPWLQTTLSEQILRLQGAQTEGIFRVPADMDEVMSLKTQLDKWEVPEEIIDAHTPASVLKLWYRELYEPLIPDSMYEKCVTYHDNPDKVLTFVEELPEINRLVLAYLIHFLQMFSKPDVASITKMDSSNLAMVMAPNCLRCTSQDPRVIFDNARKEMAFLRTLIQHMDTEFIDGIF